MKQLHRIPAYLIKSNLFIALCAVAMVLTGRLLLPTGHPPFPLALLVAVGCATFIIYNLTHFLISIQTARRNRQTTPADFYRGNIVLVILLLVCAIAFLVSLFLLRWQAVAVMALLGVLSLLYNIPDQYIHRHYQSLRTVPLMKIFVIAFVWASIGSWLPYYWTSGHWQEALGLFVAQFCFIMAITLPFDIRDYQHDEKSRLLTIPGLVGIRFTRCLALFFLVLYLCLMLLLFSHTAVPVILLVLVTAPLLIFSSYSRPYWYFTGLLDGLIVLQYLLLLVFI